MTAEEVRLGLGELVIRVGYQGETVVVTRHGKPVIALISIADLELFESLKKQAA